MRRPRTARLDCRVGVYADLYRYRELFASLFQRDLRAKYKGSALGLVWTLALPVTLMLVYLVVFSVMWKSPTTDVDHYWLFLLCGLPPWVFFATSLQSSARSLLENASLIRKVRFPAPARAALDRRDAARRVRRDDRRSSSCSR